MQHKKINKQGLILLLSISFLLIINLTLTLSIIYISMRNILYDSIIEGQLPLSNAVIYAEIKQELQPNILTSSYMSKDIFLKKWIKEGEKDRDFIKSYLNSFSNDNNTITCFLVSALSNTYYNRNGAFPITRDDPDAKWYYSFLESRKSSTINFALNVDMNNTPTVFINFLITDDSDKTLGVAGIGLSLKSIPKILNNYGNLYNRLIFFTDKNGRIIAQSSNSLINVENIHSIQEINQSINDVLEEKSLELEINLLADKYILKSMHIPELDWWLFSLQNKSEAFSNVNKVLILSFVLNSSAILLTLFFISMSVRDYQKKIKYMATTDILTKIPNRYIFEYSVGKKISKHKRNPSQTTFLLIDIDHFKSINDSLGHLVGDETLIKSAATIKSIIREADEICRWGGEEFIILLNDCDVKQGFLLAEKIRKTFEKSVIALYPNGKPLTISIGVTELKNDDTLESLFHRVDLALYKAKSEGRNCVRT